MTITTTALGSNSKRIDYTNNETYTTLLNAMADAISSLGWTLYDSTGTSKIFRAPLINSLNGYKYFSVTYAGPHFNLVSYEAWNNSTHTGTNSATLGSFSFDTTAPSSSLYIFATARYAAILSQMSGYNGYGYYTAAAGCDGSFVGCFEFTLDNGETGSAPNFCLINSLAAMGESMTPKYCSTTYYSGSPAASSVYGTEAFVFSSGYVSYFNAPGFFNYAISKLSNGSVINNGYYSVLHTNMDRPRIEVLPYKVFLSITSGYSSLKLVDNAGTNVMTVDATDRTSSASYSLNHSIKLADLLPTGNNPVTNKPWCFTPYISEASTGTLLSNTRGRVYGLKIAGKGKSWNPLDTVVVKCDANLFQDTLGTDATHVYLGNNFILPL